MNNFFSEHKIYLAAIILIIVAFCAVLISYGDIYKSNKSVIIKKEEKVLKSDIAYGKQWVKLNFSVAKNTVLYNLAMIEKSFEKTYKYLKQNNIIVKDTKSIFLNKILNPELKYLQVETSKTEKKNKRT